MLIEVAIYCISPIENLFFNNYLFFEGVKYSDIMGSNVLD